MVWGESEGWPQGSDQVLQRKTAVRFLSQAEDLGGPKLAGIQITFCPVVVVVFKAKASTVIDVRTAVLKFCRLGPARSTKLDSHSRHTGSLRFEEGCGMLKSAPEAGLELDCPWRTQLLSLAHRAQSLALLLAGQVTS